MRTIRQEPTRWLSGGKLTGGGWFDFDTVTTDGTQTPVEFQVLSASYPGTSCRVGQVYDCSMECVNEAVANSWVGDGYCDVGSWGMVLTCPVFNNDGGDCI